MRLFNAISSVYLHLSTDKWISKISPDLVKATIILALLHNEISSLKLPNIYQQRLQNGYFQSTMFSWFFQIHTTKT